MRWARLALAGISLTVAAETTVSYSADVAPIFALHCVRCHGLRSNNPAANLSLRTHAEILKGGNLGRDIVPGDAPGSPLLEFVDGRRGEAQRMPAQAAPLSAGQVETIRRWIAQGAMLDREPSPSHRLRQPVAPGKKLEIGIRVPVEALVTVQVLAADHLLHVEEAVVRAEVDGTADVRAGEWKSWTLTRPADWPREVTIQMLITHPQGNPLGALLRVDGIVSRL